MTNLLFSANRAGKATRPVVPAPSSWQPSLWNRTQMDDNVTFLLDNLLHEYDNSLRPDLGGEKEERPKNKWGFLVEGLTAE
jgi:hypothetical protein